MFKWQAEGTALSLLKFISLQEIFRALLSLVILVQGYCTANSALCSSITSLTWLKPNLTAAVWKLLPGASSVFYFVEHFIYLTCNVPFSKCHQ